MPVYLYFFASFVLPPASPSLLPPIVAQLEGEVPAEVPPPVDEVEEAPPPEPEPVAPAPEPSPAPEAEAEAPVPEPAVPTRRAARAREPTRAELELAGALRQRASVGDAHRAFGIASWISMAITLALGGIQAYDDYGPFASTEAETPCMRGQAVIQDFCGEQIPWAHMLSGILTSVLYYTTSSLSFFMPDPLHIEASATRAGERLRIHKTLRWFHVATMLLTTAFGTVTANLPHAEVDFETRQALALTHMALGATTWVLLTAAACVILF
jgi:hypothetical protein